MQHAPTLFDVPPLDPHNAPLENVLQVAAADSESQTFTNVYPLWVPQDPRQPVFGGLLIGQAINAAYKTVSENATLHHLSCSFLGSSDSSRPIFYRVARVVDSRNYANRVVSAYQREDKTQTLFTCTCGFQLDGGASPDLLTTSMPLTPPAPSTPVSPAYDAEFAHNMSRGDFLTHKGPNTARPDVDPFLWRACPPRPDETTHDLTALVPDAPGSSQLLFWVSPRGGPASPSRPSRRALLGSLTDCWLAYHVPDMLPAQLRAPRARVTKIVSLNHSVWFHGSGAAGPEREFEDWMLVRNRATWAGRGRVLLEQRVWTRGGRLVVSCVQEAIVRVQRRDGEAKI